MSNIIRKKFKRLKKKLEKEKKIKIPDNKALQVYLFKYVCNWPHLKVISAPMALISIGHTPFLITQTTPY